MLLLQHVRVMNKKFLHSLEKKLHFLWEIEFQYVFISTTIALLLPKGGKHLIFLVGYIQLLELDEIVFPFPNR